MLQLQACILGGDDFAANLGATRTTDNRELEHARGMFLLTCRAMQVRPCSRSRALKIETVAVCCVLHALRQPQLLQGCHTSKSCCLSECKTIKYGVFCDTPLLSLLLLMSCY
jgi:hypothetical protein